MSGMTPVEVALVIERDHDRFAAEVIEAGATPPTVIKHLINNLSGGIGKLTAPALAELVAMEERSQLTSTQVKKVLAEMVQHGGHPEEVSAQSGFVAIDTGEIEKLVDQLIGQHPDEWARFCDGEKKVQGFFVGQVMKATEGQADGKLINQILNKRSSG